MQIRKVVFQIYTTYIRTTVLKTLKLLGGAFSAASMLREDIRTVFCGNTENMDTTE